MKGNFNGSRLRYIEKKYCSTCRLWRMPDELHLDKGGGLACNECGIKVRVKPRNSKFKEENAALYYKKDNGTA